MTDAEAFMKIGEKFSNIEQRLSAAEALLDRIIATLQNEPKDGTEQPKTNR